MDAQELEDKDLLTLMREASYGKIKGKKKKLPFKKLDIVWIIQVYDSKTGKLNKVTPSHLQRSKKEHQSAGEELVGALGVICYSNPKKKTTKVFLVHDGAKPDTSLQICIKERERIHYDYDLFKYIPSKELNDRIIASIQRSFKDEDQGEKATEYTHSLLKLVSQRERVDNYFKRIESKEHVPTLEFLISAAQFEDSSKGEVKTQAKNEENQSLNIKSSDSYSRNHYIVKNDEALEFFRTNSAQEYLWKIMSGQVESRRHNILVAMRYPRTDFRSEIFGMLNACFLADELQIDHKMRRASSDIYDGFMSDPDRKQTLSFLIHPKVFKQTYLQFVLEPEGLIYLLMTRDQLNRQEAEKNYLKPILLDEDVEAFDRELEAASCINRNRSSPQFSKPKVKKRKKKSPEPTYEMFELPDIDGVDNVWEENTTEADAQPGTDSKGKGTKPTIFCRK